MGRSATVKRSTYDRDLKKTNEWWYQNSVRAELGERSRVIGIIAGRIKVADKKAVRDALLDLIELLGKGAP